MGATGYGAAQGLESVLSRLFQEAQAKQQAAEAQARMDLQRQTLAQDQSQHEARMGFDREKFGAEQQNAERTYSINAGNMAMRGTEFAQGVVDTQAERERQAAADAANAAWKGTELANTNAQNELDRQNQRQVAGINHANSGAGTSARDAAQSDMIDNALQTVSLLENAPGFSGAIGAPSLTQPGSWPRAVGMDALAGSEAAGADSYMKQLVGQLTLPNLTVMRGMGALSDRDMQVIQSAMTALNAKIPEAQARVELGRIRDTLSQAKTRMSNGSLGVPMQPGAPRQAPTATGAPAVQEWGRGPNGVPVRK